jgi:hypothetical protein
MTWCPRLAVLAALLSSACSSYTRATDAADASSELPPITTDVPPVTTDVPAVTTDVPAVGVDEPAVVPDVPAPIDAPSPTPDVGTAYTCPRLCRRLPTVTGCAGAESGCVSRCTTDIGRFPPACNGQLEALFTCIEGTPASRISCGAMMFPFQDCSALNGQAIMCVMNNP